MTHYLISRSLYRSIGFFHHWYWHTFLILKRPLELVKKWPVVYWLTFIVSAIFYLLWAIAPVYLVVRIFWPDLWI